MLYWISLRNVWVRGHLIHKLLLFGHTHDRPTDCSTCTTRVVDCCWLSIVAAIESWMTANRLNMNTDKTDFIWLGSKHQLAKIQSQSIAVEAVHAPVSSVVTCLGVQFDSHLTFTPHVQGLARRCFYHLRQLRSVRRSLTTDSAKTLVHALIASRLDYCNSVLYQINTTATKTLQSVLHSAARLIVRKRKFESITSTPRDNLHWLPVRERIVFKLCVIIFKCRHQTAPQYLQELCVPVTASTSRIRSWRSASASLPQYQFWTTQLCCLCSKTVELSTTVTSWSNIDIDTFL